VITMSWEDILKEPKSLYPMYVVWLNKNNTGWYLEKSFEPKEKRRQMFESLKKNKGGYTVEGDLYGGNIIHYADGISMSLGMPKYKYQIIEEGEEVDKNFTVTGHHPQGREETLRRLRGEAFPDPYPEEFSEDNM